MKWVFVIVAVIMFALIFYYSVNNEKTRTRKKALGLYRRKRYGRTISLLEAKRNILGEDFYYSLLIEILTETKDIENLLRVCDEAIEAKIESSMLYNNISYAYFEAELMDKALEYADKCIELNDKFAAPHANKGNCYYILGNVSKALESFDKALSINKDLPAALYGKGICLYIQKKYDECEEYLLRYSKINRKSINTFKLLADLYFENKDFSSAARMYESIISVDSTLPWAYYELGNVLFFDGDLFRALTSLDKAIELDNNCYIAYYYKCRIFSIFRRIDIAFDCLEKAIEGEKYLKLIAFEDNFLNNLKIYSRFKDVVGYRKNDIVAELQVTKDD